MQKPAQTQVPIHELLAARWSPLSFSSRDVSREDLLSLCEAARWAPSCFNEQPWRYLVGSSADPAGLAKMRSCLVEANARWADRAPVLMLSVAKTRFTRNDMPNRHAGHDVGLATSQLVLQASARGLVVHQMAGFDVQKAIELLGIPAGHEPMAMIAIGYPGEPSDLPEELREREAAPRSRRSFEEVVFGPGWETSL